jgi:peptidoglycan hydrolase-like protein with peptidoglycan-binding domain
MFKKLIWVLFVFASLVIGGYAQGTDKSGSNTAAKTEEPKKAPIFRPTKDQIKQVQTILKEKKLYTGEPSGKYDDDTHAGIKVFQKNNGLKDTGGLNRATLEKFGIELTDSQKKIPVNPNSYASGESSGKNAKSTEDKPKRAAPFKATKDQVTEAQKLLTKMSMYSGPEDGKFSDDFRAGLKKFQEAKGMKVTGTLNAATLEKMGIALTDSQKKNAAQ